MTTPYYRTEEYRRKRLSRKTTMPRMSRREMFSRLQILQVINPIVEDSYRVALRRRHRDQTDDSPHGFPWHTSFHASQFDGDDPLACPRQSLYRLIDLPGSVQTRRLRLTAEAGKTLEVDMVTMMDEAGTLISAPPDAEHQTAFVLDHVMLTGTVDSATEINGRAVPVEIKTKHESQIEEMRQGKRGPDAKHVKQLKTQLGLVRGAQEAGELWDDLKICTYGVIYYMPRDTKYNPGAAIPTAEFVVEYDQHFFEEGTERLKEYIEYFKKGELPSVNPSAKHPMGWRWSYPPCQYCNYKKICQEDHKQEITELALSVGVEDAKDERPHYVYDDAVARVVERWPEIFGEPEDET